MPDERGVQIWPSDGLDPVAGLLIGLCGRRHVSPGEGGKAGRPCDPCRHPLLVLMGALLGQLMQICMQVEL